MKFKNIVFWVSRILSILVTICVYAFIFEISPTNFKWPNIFLAAIPGTVLLLVSALAWNFPKYGGLVYIFLGLLYAVIETYRIPSYGIIALVSGALILTGAGFLIEGKKIGINLEPASNQKDKTKPVQETIKPVEEPLPQILTTENQTIEKKERKEMALPKVSIGDQFKNLFKFKKKEKVSKEKISETNVVQTPIIPVEKEVVKEDEIKENGLQYQNSPLMKTTVIENEEKKISELEPLKKIQISEPTNITNDIEPKQTVIEQPKVEEPVITPSVIKETFEPEISEAKPMQILGDDLKPEEVDLLKPVQQIEEKVVAPVTPPIIENKPVEEKSEDLVSTNFNVIDETPDELIPLDKQEEDKEEEKKTTFEELPELTLTSKGKFFEEFATKGLPQKEETKPEEPKKTNGVDIATALNSDKKPTKDFLQWFGNKDED